MNPVFDAIREGILSIVSSFVYDRRKIERLLYTALQIVVEMMITLYTGHKALLYLESDH